MGSISLSVFQCLGFAHVSSDSCHLRELWLRWAALELSRLLSCGSHGICSLPVQGRDSQQRQANPAVVVMIQENSTKLIFGCMIACKLLLWPFLMNIQLYMRVCVCVFSFQKYFLYSCFWMSACPSSSNTRIVGQ